MICMGLVRTKSERSKLYSIIKKGSTWYNDIWVNNFLEGVSHGNSSGKIILDKNISKNKDPELGYVFSKLKELQESWWGSMGKWHRGDV
jgi:hypothetical protein